MGCVSELILFVHSPNKPASFPKKKILYRILAVAAQSTQQTDVDSSSMAAVSFATSPVKDVLGEVRRSGEGLLPSAQFFKQMGVRCVLQ